MPDLRFAVMVGKLLGREDVLAIGPSAIGIAAGFVERIDDQRAFHFDGAFLLAFVEHQASAEAAHRRSVGSR
jgi:hypothetical protein